MRIYNWIWDNLMLKLYNKLMFEVLLFSWYEFYISIYLLNKNRSIKEEATELYGAMDHEAYLDTILVFFFDSLQDYNVHGNAFCPFCGCLLQIFFFFCQYYFLRKSPFIIVLDWLKYSAYFRRVFRGLMTRVPLEDMLCVDLCNLLFRTCLVPSRAMTVCMAKDLLVYTAAMAVGVINSKVIYKCYLLRSSRECCFRTIDLLLDWGIDGII